MRFIFKLLGYAAVAAVAFFVAIMGASEFSGEVVTLRTFQENGLSRETSLWIVEDRGRLYLRAGTPESGWLARLAEHPQVELVRDGASTAYRAVLVPRQRARVNELMAEKYGWGESLVALSRDSAKVTIVRLDPVRDD